MSTKADYGEIEHVIKVAKGREKTFKIGFLLDHHLMHYRLPFFQQLSERGFEIIVYHSGKKLAGNYLFEQVTVKNIKFRGLEYRKVPVLKGFDVIVCMQNIRLINLWLFSCNLFRTFKLIQWGIGVSSSKGLKPTKSFISRTRNLLASCAEAQILYSTYPLSLFSSKVRSKTFIANNTIDNPESSDLSSMPKNSVLFIGSLNNRKRLDILIRSFLKYLELYRPGRIINLNIIGEGEIKQELINQIGENPFKTHIRFIGKIEDYRQKIQYFKDSIICVSPKQAGLSVLESFSYGVPFVTFTDSISGGEHLNIIDGQNGYIVDNEETLVQIFKQLDADENLGRFLGRNAFMHYDTSRKMKDMVDSFEAAFNYVLN